MELRPGYKQTDTGLIPEDWKNEPLIGRVSISHGYAFSSKYFGRGGPYRLTTPGHFHEAGGFRDLRENQKFYSGPVPSDYVLQSGDVIVAMTEQADGLLGSAAVIPESSNYLHNQRLGRMRILTPEIDLRYLVTVFNSPAYRAKVRETAAGTKVKHTSPSKLLEIAVRLPPPSEQRAIAAAVFDADELVASLDALIAKKRDLKHAAMQQLLTGRTCLPSFTGEWQVRRIGDVVRIEKGELITSETLTTGHVPVIAGGKQAAYFHAHSNRKGPVVTISASGASAGYVSFHSQDIFASDCSTILGGAGYDLRFIYFLLCLHQEHIYRAQTGGAQPHIHAKDINPMMFAFPPTLANQTAIAAVLVDMEAELAVLEARRDKARALKHGMMQELLTGRIRLV